MRVTVSGVGGFVGRHLVRELQRRGAVLRTTSHGPRPPWLDEDVAFVSGDLTRGWPEPLFDGADAIVHLAGLSAVGPSFERPQDYLDQNSAMVTRLGETLLRTGARPRVLVVSSGAVYDPAHEQPIREDGPLAMTSPYVVSKALVESVAAYYARRGLDLVLARPFNHVGPGQGGGFLVPDLIAEALAARRESRPMRAGDLSTARDYTDVRDVVRAYGLLLEAPLERAETVPVFNVCSGVPRSGEEVRATVLRALGMDDPGVEVDPARVRPTEARTIVGDSTALRALTDWAPTIGFGTTVADTVASALGRGRSSLL